MRIAGLLTLAILSPAFVWAAALVNINTADKATLMSLTGLGGTGVKAQAVIDYRTAHGSFAQISDIQNVSGIGPSTYAGLKDFITVGEASVPDTTASSTSDTATTTPASSGSSGSGGAYTPPPSSIAVNISGAQKAFMEVPMTLSARVTSKSGVIDPFAQIIWSFGDGSSALGNEVTKTYHYAGTYVVTATANNGIAKARDEIIISVVPSQVHILSVSSEGIMITNDSDERLDLSQWRLSSSMGSFRIPEGTTILSEASVLFPSAITNLPASFDATLSYPDGIVAARFVPTIVTPQPSVEPVSSNQVQTVEDIISTKAPVESYENKAVIAPTATPDTGAAVGAKVTAPTAPPTLAAAATAPEAPKTPSGGLLHSVWTLGLLGVVALAGGAFILL